MDEFGPLNLQPHPGKQWAPVAAGKGDAGSPRRRRRRATCTRPHHVHPAPRGPAPDGWLCPVDRPALRPRRARKGRTAFLAFCRYLRSLHPPEVRIAIVLDNFSPYRSTTKDTRAGDWAEASNVELAYVPFYASWLNRIEAPIHRTALLSARRHRPRQPRSPRPHDPPLHGLAKPPRPRRSTTSRHQPRKRCLTRH